MSPPSSRKNGTAPSSPCPTCGKPSTPASRPFCSGRCADVDLQGWLSERYAVPVAKTHDEDDPDDPATGDGPGQGGRGSL